MTFEEYNELERQNSALLIATLLVLLRPYLGVPLSPFQWTAVLLEIFPYVEAYRYESGRIARLFYDDERARLLSLQVVDLDDYRGIQSIFERHPVFLANYDVRWFEEAMDAVRVRFSSELATDSDLLTTIAVAVKEAQNGGRATLREAVQTDPQAVGWARVEGGGESCAFCLMLISRGPVYKNANEAGLKAASNESAIEIWQRYDRTGNDSELMDLMARWHENCDCRVVPVFDELDWPGRDEYLDAEALWAKTTKGFGGGRNGGDKLKAFRRALGDGYKRGSVPQAA